MSGHSTESRLKRPCTNQSAPAQALKLPASTSIPRLELMSVPNATLFTGHPVAPCCFLLELSRHTICLFLSYVSKNYNTLGTNHTHNHTVHVRPTPQTTLSPPPPELCLTSRSSQGYSTSTTHLGLLDYKHPKPQASITPRLLNTLDPYPRAK